MLSSAHPVQFCLRRPLVFLQLALAVSLAPAALASDETIVEIVDATGDGVGNILTGSNGIAVDAGGNVYVTGAASDNVFRITPGGTIAEIIDQNGDLLGKVLDSPKSVAVDASGNVYVPGGVSDNVFRVTPGGIITEIMDASGDGMGKTLDFPSGVALDAGGNLYVAGSQSNNVFEITPGGAITEIVDQNAGGGVYLDDPFGLAVDPSNGNVFVSGLTSNNVLRITPSGAITEIIDIDGDGVFPSSGTPLLFPVGVAVDEIGNVYVTGADIAYGLDIDTVFQVRPGGNVKLIIDSTGDGGGNPLDEPYGVAVGPSGRVYVSGAGSDNAFRINPPPTWIPVPSLSPLCLALMGAVMGAVGVRRLRRVSSRPFIDASEMQTSHP